MFLKQLGSSLMIILLIFSMAAAQLPTKQEDAQADQQAVEAHRQAESRAVALLDEILKEGQRLTLAENRIQVQTIVADLLWKYDEARSRSLFKAAVSELSLLPNDPSNPDEDDVRQAYNAARMRSQLRQMLMKALAHHDARLARDFMRATRRSETSASTPANAVSEETQMELNLASQLAANDPKQATEVAEETLAKGLSYQLPQVVAQLARKDREAANKLASSIVARLRNENLATNSEALGIAQSLLRLGAEPSAASSSAQTDSKNAQPLIDEQVLRELAEMVATVALNDKSNRIETYSIPSLMPLIEKYAPSRAALLRSRAAQSKKTVASEELAASDNYRALAENGTVESLLEAAQKAPDYLRDQYYLQAASKALKQDDQARAQQIINQNIKEPYQRKMMLASLERQMLAKALEKGKIDEARQLIAQTRTNEERVRLLTELATGIGAKGDKKVALQLLDEARNLSSARARNIKQLTAQFQIARAYAALDPARSLVILESFMDQVNELLNAALLLGGFLAEDEIVKDDEVLLLALASITDMSGGQLMSELGALADADFDRTKGVADSFQRAELRLAARLLIVQSVLAERTATGNPPVVAPALGPEGQFGIDDQ
jgi:hypothetical protein